MNPPPLRPRWPKRKDISDDLLCNTHAGQGGGFLLQLALFRFVGGCHVNHIPSR